MSSPDWSNGQSQPNSNNVLSYPKKQGEDLSKEVNKKDIKKQLEKEQEVFSKTKKVLEESEIKPKHTWNI